MKKYKYDGITEEMKTLPNEINVKEFQEIVKLQNDFNGDFNYYLDTFGVLGLSETFLDAIDDKTLYMLIGDFQEDFNLKKNVFTKSIEIDGYKYTAYEDTFKLGARDLANIENEMIKDPNGWITYALAIIFKREDLTPVEHKANAHIKLKEKLFKSVTMDIALPYIFYIAESYVSNIKILIEQ